MKAENTLKAKATRHLPQSSHKLYWGKLLPFFCPHREQTIPENNSKYFHENFSPKEHSHWINMMAVIKQRNWNHDQTNKIKQAVDAQNIQNLWTHLILFAWLLIPTATTMVFVSLNFKPFWLPGFFFFLFRLAKVFVCRTLQYFQQSQLYSLPSYVCGNIKTLQWKCWWWPINRGQAFKVSKK